jgi:lipopolysaccharide transport system permease protein
MKEPTITIYTPDSQLASPRTLMRGMLKDLAAGRELAWRLAVRDLSAQYRQAILGFLWAIILPLANAAVWIMLSRSGVVTVSQTELPYYVYVFIGTMLWAIFMDALNAPLQLTMSSRAMLAKINFPREALIVAGIYQTLFNALIKSAIMIGVLLLLGINPGWNLLLFPVGLFSLILVGTTAGLLVTPIGLLYTDVGKAIPLLMQFMMYLTPVVFPMPQEGMVARLFEANPLTPLILTTRDWLTGFTPDYIGYFLLVNFGAVLILLAVWVVFRLAMPILIERMGS